MADLETIHREMLEELDKSYQKSPGYPAYDFTRAFALGVVSLAGDVEAAESRLDPENLSGYDLERYVWQHRALERRGATYAAGTVKITAGAGHVSAGDLFATAAGVMFASEEDKDVSVGSTVAVTAVEPGSAGNAGAGTITTMPVTIQGIGGVTNEAAFTGGVDEESDQELRERYYDVLTHPANGGNVYQYRQWALSVDGVGRAVVVPTPDGANTVDVVLIDGNGAPASSALAAAVQALIDPNGNGDGAGEAPIGAVCTVSAATAKTLNFAATLSLEEDGSQSAVTDAVGAALDALCKKTALAGTSLRYADVVAAVLVEGVADYSALTINGATGSVTFGTREVPVKGTVTITYASS